MCYIKLFVSHMGPVIADVKVMPSLKQMPSMMSCTEGGGGGGRDTLRTYVNLRWYGCG